MDVLPCSIGWIKSERYTKISLNISVISYLYFKKHYIIKLTNLHL